jgi:protein SCO1/2/putative membrane protein
MNHSSRPVLKPLRSACRAALFACLIAAIAGASARAADKQPKWNQAGLEDFSLTECHGRTVTKADLLGKPWVACFIFTRCAGPCPKVSQQMQLLQERVKGLDVRLVSLTVDPERDTPEELQRYAEHYQADPERWWFLTGDKEAIFHLIERGFRMIVEDDPQQIPGFEVKHSTTMMLVDAGGVVRGKYNALNDVEMARLRRAILGQSNAADQAIIDEGDANDLRQAELQRQAEAAAARAAREAELAERSAAVPEWVVRLPAVNASLNGLATVLLVAGYVAIRTGRTVQHKRIMLTAFGTSAAFLVCYLVYHAALAHFTGDGSRRFAGSGPIRFVYFAILISHVLLAIVVAVLAPTVLYRALRGQFERHKRLARITFPIWLYVSVTGVIIYVILYHWPVGPV